MLPIVSVIMPAYNAARFIKPAITSILQQTMIDFELIIVDDASTDNTLEVIRGFSDPRIVLLINKQNLKAGKARNIAIESSRGKYIALCDADDINMLNRLEVQVTFLESHPEVDVVGSNMYLFDKEGNILGGLSNNKTKHNDIIRVIPWQTPLAHATIMGKAIWFLKYKYNGNYIRSEDYDLFLRSHKDSKFANIPYYLYAIRDPKVMSLKHLFSYLYSSYILLYYFRNNHPTVKQLAKLPIFLGGKLLYFIICYCLGKNMFMRHIVKLPWDNKFKLDQDWINSCLK